MIFLLLVFITLCLIQVHSIPFNTGSGSCEKSRLCCDGKNNSCVVEYTMISPYTSKKKCFCDDSCTQTNDCCNDYKYYCKAIDCRVTQWDNWSECSSTCGQGVMSRKRNITRYPSKGGEPCPELEQQRACFGSRCAQNDDLESLREVARLLPAKYSIYRTIDESKDIRRNLRSRYPRDPIEEAATDYCVEFDLETVSKRCQDIWLNNERKLVPGTRVCARCEKKAMEKHLSFRCVGNGVIGSSTRWFMVFSEECNGRWIRRSKDEKCRSCQPDFIFV